MHAAGRRETEQPRFGAESGEAQRHGDLLVTRKVDSPGMQYRKLI